MKIAILRDHNPESSQKWEIACDNKNISYKTINMLKANWLKEIENFNPDFCISRPPGDIQLHKKIFDEKIYFLEYFKNHKIFPGFLETFIYENKATLALFLQTNNISHPETFVSSNKTESLEFIRNRSYPIVAKTLIGAAGSGVKIIKTHKEAKEYVLKAFTTGIKRRFGPNRKTGNPKAWFTKAIKSPEYFLKKLKLYKERNQDVQKNIVLFQEYIPHDYEWRCVKIGESFFAYKKMKIGEMTSGSKQFEYGAPPEKILSFTKELCDRFLFNFMAVDLFYSNNQIYVNELQTIFGHKNPYITKVNNKPGRYIYKDNRWVFEEGNFNTNESYDLRLETAINLFLSNHNIK